MNEPIDIYCERLGPGFWSEPVNALTNIAFIIAAIAAFLLAKKEKALYLGTGLLILLVFGIGIGSGLFHTFATGWAKLADILPILLFQMGFLITYARRVIGLSAMMSFRLFMVFILLIIGSGYLPYEWFNGSLGYAPALTFLIGFGIYHYRHNLTEPKILLIASGVFLLSLTFRSMDMMLCESVPIGVHFLWHLLNALVLYLSLRALIRNRAA